MSPWSENAGRLIAQALATLLGVPVPPSAWIAFAVQAERECAGGTSVGARNNDPLNLTTANGTITWSGQTGTYGGGDATEWHGDFAAFGSLVAGCWACASNYDGGSYGNVLDAFRAGDPVAIATAIQQSPWDSGHYGGTLADEVRSEIGGDMTPDDVKALIATYAQGLETDELLPIKGRLDVLERAANTHTHETTAPKVAP